ncbi:hypothetical protein GCM10022600_08260 [Qipengyuania pelagi]
MPHGRPLAEKMRHPQWPGSPDSHKTARVATPAMRIHGAIPPLSQAVARIARPDRRLYEEDGYGVAIPALLFLSGFALRRSQLGAKAGGCFPCESLEWR